VVECLLADAQPAGEICGSLSLWAGVLDDYQVGGVEVGESLGVQPFENPFLYSFPRQAKQCPDQRRPEWFGLAGR
jgi:hypothetical protein